MKKLKCICGAQIKKTKNGYEHINGMWEWGHYQFHEPHPKKKILYVGDSFGNMIKVNE